MILSDTSLEQMLEETRQRYDRRQSHREYHAHCKQAGKRSAAETKERLMMRLGRLEINPDVAQAVLANLESTAEVAETPRSLPGRFRSRFPSESGTSSHCQRASPTRRSIDYRRRRTEVVRCH